MIDPAVILFANEAFYLAFNGRDLEAMDNLWARHTSPVCIHPGWSPLTNRTEIIESFENIFENQAEIKLECHFASVFYQQNIMSVICYERLQEGWLVAANNYVMEDHSPRIFHHQASQCFNPPDLSTEPLKQVQ